MSYKDKLLSLISESSVVFGGVEYNNPQGDEETVASEIQAAIGLYGANFQQYSDGIITAYTRSKTSVVSFSEYLDNHDHVDSYDITAKVYNEFGVVSDNEDIDFDLVPDSEFIEYYIDIAITPSEIEYLPMYVDSDNEFNDTTIDMPFNYYNDGDDNEYSLDQSDTPLLINVVDIDSHSQFGSFSVTVHPNDASKFLIQCNYSDYPEMEEVAADLSLINDYMNSIKLQESFQLVSQAEYTEGELSTTSAVYQSKNKKEDVLNIVEAFKDNSIIYYSEELNEIQRVIKVNFRGKRRIKMQCRKGFKYDDTRKVCVKIAGSELSVSRIAHRQMARTKKASGTGYNRRIVRKANRAKRFRKLIGL